VEAVSVFGHSEELLSPTAGLKYVYLLGPLPWDEKTEYFSRHGD